MEINFNEVHRIEEKANLFGKDALTDDELYTLSGTYAVLSRYLHGRTEQERADKAEGYELFKSLPPEEQKKYENCTPEQFQALWPVIKELGSSEGDPT